MPQLTQLSLANYKAFLKRADFQIRPLTLFFGYNSAGKSAALRFLRLLSDTILEGGSSPLNLRSEILRGSDFTGLLSKHSSSPRMDIELCFGETCIYYSILNLPDRHKQIIERLKIVDGVSGVSKEFEWAPEERAPEANDQIYKMKNGADSVDVQILFDGLIPTSFPEYLATTFDPIASWLKNFGLSFVSLSPDCVIPERFEFEIAPAKRISRRGEGMMSILQAASKTTIAEISKWYEVATGYSFERNRITIGDRSGHRFTLHPNFDPALDIDIVDTGEGMGQVLPVVGLVTLAQNGEFGHSAIISLEHPDLHLHPDAHIHLANLFCGAAVSKFAPKILVETHSENLLLGVQLAIAEKRILPSDVALHWVRGVDQGAIVELIEFDDQARPVKENWPIDVFRTNSKLARELFEKRRASQE